MVVGLQQLRTLFDTYEQFVGHLCNVFEICKGLVTNYGEGGGLQNGRGGHVKFYPYEKGGRKKFWPC